MMITKRNCPSEGYIGEWKIHLQILGSHPTANDYHNTDEVIRVVNELSAPIATAAQVITIVTGGGLTAGLAPDLSAESLHSAGLGSIGMNFPPLHYCASGMVPTENR